MKTAPIDYVHRSCLYNGLNVYFVIESSCPSDTRVNLPMRF